MNDTLHIDNETLVAYLYDEVDAPVKAQVERHLQQCGMCGGEFAALSGVRTVMKSWTPPTIDLGFTVVQKSAHQAPAPVLRPSPWWNTVPVWAQAAAAILVLAISAGVANIQVRSDADGFVVTTGWMSPQESATAAATPVMAADATGGENWKGALTALESQLRNEIRSSRDAGASRTRVAARSTPDEAILRRVQELVTASETRQQRELALRLTQHQRDFDIQRRADLVRLERGLGQFEGRTVAEQTRQRQMLNYVMRVSGTPQQ